MIQPGEINQRITFERLGPAEQDAYGQATTPWVKWQTVWAGVKTLSGRQLQLAQANTITSTATHSVKVRYLEGVEIASMRLTLPQRGGGTRIFRINHIDDIDNQGVELVMTVTEDLT